ncbi:Hypothetical protein, putative [Bodo saltans]|uniref:Uncharacterized protein n=1 Tax=Bodo saltans TaxID=75058 RepID=A0A0S4J2T5_BODSA|nr:Hypothetical protein, putative [Bodo saltans]|eukprot:CUG61384.1 Hypothetical protein, putative [Bodo saltans]
MFGRCLEGVWKVFGRCLEGVHQCLEGCDGQVASHSLFTCVQRFPPYSPESLFGRRVVS